MCVMSNGNIHYFLRNIKSLKDPLLEAIWIIKIVDKTNI